jgi:hypothetical protein
MNVNPVATGAVYLALALPPTLWAVRHTARPWAAGIFGAVCGIVLAVVLNPYLPFDFWVHARDFLIEPFLERRIFRDLPRGLLTTAFHFGVPVLVAIVVYRRRPRSLD